jgi:hypothetical protein
VLVRVLRRCRLVFHRFGRSGARGEQNRLVEPAKTPFRSSPSPRARQRERPVK